MHILKKLCLTAIVFLYVFGPVFRPIGAWFDAIFIVSLLLTVYNVLVLRTKPPAVFRKFYSLLFVFFYAFISIFISKGYAEGELLRFALIPIRIFVTLYGGYTLVLIFQKKFKENYFKILLQIVFMSFIIHSLIMIVQLYHIPFKDFIYLYTSTGEFRSSYEYSFRMGGLSGGPGGSVLSVVQSLGIILIPILYRKVDLKRKILLILGGAIIFYSILICGRSGIWTVLIFLPTIVFLLSKSSGLGIFLKFSFIVLLLASVLIASLSLVGSADSESSTYYALRRSLDTFMKYEQNSKLEDKTVETVAGMWFIPKDLSVLIAGDPEHLVNTQFQRTLDSDVGYIRNIWGYGIIFGFCFWLPIIRISFLAFRNRNFNDATKLLLIFSLIMLVFQAKENFLYVRMFLSLYSLVLFSMFLEIKKRKNILIK